MDSPRKPSMVDVGKLAGVSHQTVSRVINHKGYVTDSTRLVVEQAMEELSFRPNRAARGLALRRTESIGVVNIGKPENASLAQAHFGITTTAALSNYSVTLINVADSEHPNALDESVDEALNSLLGYGVDGIILVSPFSVKFAMVSKLATEVPMVEFGSESMPGISSVSTDGELGGRLVGEHLVSLGHTRIAYVDGPDDRSDARDRRRGIETALKIGGAQVVRREIGDWTSVSGYGAGVTLRNEEDITAIFCANDQMALGLVHAFSEIGKFASTDFSVVGFDDIPDAAHFIPPLTTVRQDFTDLGRRSFRELKRLIEGGSPHRILVPPTLVVRSSTTANH